MWLIILYPQKSLAGFQIQKNMPKALTARRRGRFAVKRQLLLHLPESAECAASWFSAGREPKKTVKAQPTRITRTKPPFVNVLSLYQTTLQLLAITARAPRSRPTRYPLAICVHTAKPGRFMFFPPWNLMAFQHLAAVQMICAIRILGRLKIFELCLYITSVVKV